MSSESAQHFELLHKILFDNKNLQVKDLQVLDASKFVKYLEQHALLSIACRHLIEALPEEAIPAELLLANIRRASFNLLLEQEHYKVLKILSKADVPVLALKGPALSSELYGEAGLRDSGDIDFMVPRSKLEKVLALLAEHDYYENKPILGAFARAFDRSISHSCELQQAESGMLIDLHWAMAERFYVSPAFTRDVWRDSLISALNDVFFRAPDPYFNFIFLCLQAFKEQWRSLGRLYDIYNFRKKFTIDLAKALDLAEKYDLSQVVLRTVNLIESTFVEGEAPQALPVPEVIELFSCRKRFVSRLRVLVYRYLLPFGADFRIQKRSLFLPVYFFIKPIRVLARGLVSLPGYLVNIKPKKC